MRSRGYCLARYLRQLFTNLPRRAWLTLRWQGPRTFFFRLVTFPLRLTPLGPRLGFGPRFHDPSARAKNWYEKHARFTTIVVPTYGPPDTTIATVKAVRRTVSPCRTRIVVTDDGSAPEHRDRLRRLKGIDLLLAEETAGFAGNANRGLRAATDGDVVLLNSDVIPHEGWLEALQFGAYGSDDIGIVGPKLLYPDGTIQSAGSHRNLGAPEWFDHRYRFRPSHHGPANIIAPAVAMTGACLYLKRSTLDRLGLLDEEFGMAYEDVDYCLRAWDAGLRVIYYPASVLTHLESKTRGTTQGERELAAQRYFWGKWGDWFDQRNVRAEDGRLRVIYVTEDTGIGGGHRVVFEHLNRLSARGHHAELYSLEGPPDWFELDVPVRAFASYDELVAELADREAIKVATWWNTAAPVWNASIRKGLPAYFVQDIETSYYPGDRDTQDAVMASYRPEFRFMATSGWVCDRLRELGVEPAQVAPGVDVGRYRDLRRRRADEVLLAVGRSHHLKNLELTVEAWRALQRPRTELWLFGIEPELGAEHRARYFEGPDDEEVNELLNTATVFVQTSRHEGFCLPLLEAMAARIPVVCTDANGNLDFCRDEVNCLMPQASPRAVRDSIERLLVDPDLRRRLSEQGRATAQRYEWSRQIDDLERFLESIAVERVPA